jgi:beta-phosphoglucomutase-like phosphatase (HAD superfamily)
MKKRIRAVAWDVDGTLVDSEPLHHRALVAASSQWGGDLSDLTDQAFQGVHIADVLIALKPRMPDGLDKSEWIAAITTHYIENCRELEPLPGWLKPSRRLLFARFPKYACRTPIGRSLTRILRPSAFCRRLTSS